MKTYVQSEKLKPNLEQLLEEARICEMSISIAESIDYRYEERSIMFSMRWNVAHFMLIVQISHGSRIHEISLFGNETSEITPSLSFIHHFSNCLELQVASLKSFNRRSHDEIPTDRRMDMWICSL